MFIKELQSLITFSIIAALNKKYYAKLQLQRKS